MARTAVGAPADGLVAEGGIEVINPATGQVIGQVAQRTALGFLAKQAPRYLADRRVRASALLMGKRLTVRYMFPYRRRTSKGLMRLMRFLYGRGERH